MDNEGEFTGITSSSLSLLAGRFLDSDVIVCNSCFNRLFEVVLLLLLALVESEHRLPYEKQI